MIRTPDQRLRVFFSSTLAELSPEREAVQRAIKALALKPVMLELEARPYAPPERLDPKALEDATAAGARLNRSDAIELIRDRTAA